ncbi:hypothetical protein M2138_000526 [Dysgonomonadaceae bacterium PH5-43]|nr:hypothetical protein [Dysgonomonadaceae bacterium PH5-43]
MKKKYYASLFALMCLFTLNSTIEAQNDNTPMMGWSSWNTFRINISEDLIKASADAMVDKGLKDAGYTFVNVDDGFFGGRATDGTMLIHPTRFPNGMKVVADYIHSKGLKAGIYSDAGTRTCGSIYDADTYGETVGLYRYEEQDAKMYFDEWDYDFIKIDYCGGQTLGLDEETQYTNIWNAMQKTDKVKNGGKIRWNICRWMFPGTWAGDIAGSWRISHDIRQNFSGTLGVIDVLEHNLYLSAYAGPGHFNDMDMMWIGSMSGSNKAFSDDQEKSYFGLWCIMNSPLMIGCDMRNIPQSSIDIITNKEVIALNQDVLGLQAQVVSRDGKKYVLAKMIEQDQGKVRGVALFNGTSSAAKMRINFKDIDLSEKAQVRDLYAKQDLGTFTGFYEVNVPANGIAMLRIEGESAFDKTKFEGEDAFINLYNGVAIDDNKYTGALFSSKYGASGDYTLKNLGGKADNWAEFRRVYSTDGGKYKLKLFYYSGDDRNLTVTVNGTEYQMTNLNSGGDGVRGRAFLNEIELKQGYNTIRFSNATGKAPEIDKFVLLDPNDPGDDNEEDLILDEEIIVNTKFPTISSEDDSNEVWYYIQFRSENGVLCDMGEGELIETKQKAIGSSAQLWKVIKTANKYTFVNKTGRKMSFADGRFNTSSTESVTVDIVATTNSSYTPAWEIQRTGASGCMNQWGGAGLDVQLGEWSKGDAGNALLFVCADRIRNFFPEVSDANNVKWYYLQFINSNKVIQGGNAGEPIIARDPLPNKDGQLWKITASGEQYILTNKLGNSIAFNNNAYDTDVSEIKGVPFDINYTETENGAAWELQRKDATATALGQTTGITIGENATNDKKNAIEFRAAKEVVYNIPTVSTTNNESWYYIQFRNGNGVITDMGVGEELLTKEMTKNDNSQIWKVLATTEATTGFKYVLVNKNGNIISYNPTVSGISTGVYLTTNLITEAAKFNFVATTNSTYKPAWELAREGSTRHLSQHSSAGFNKKITDWTKNNSRNTLVFVDLDQAEPTLSGIYKVEVMDIPTFTVNGKTLIVTGNNISKVNIYSITGQLLDTNSTSFSFSIAEAGSYIVAVTYKDGAVFNGKVVIG